MKYKVGDKVRVRQYKALAREFGINKNGVIKCSIKFVDTMEKYCGRIATINSVGPCIYNIDLDGCNFNWTDDMFEVYAFEYGDEIKVRNTEKGVWFKRLYVGYIDGDKFPYHCVRTDDEEHFKKGKPFRSLAWQHARPIQKEPEVEINVKINGKEVKLKDISEETLLRIRNADL